MVRGFICRYTGRRDVRAPRCESAGYQASVRGHRAHLALLWLPKHLAILYDYTAPRGRAGPEEFLKGYRGYLQADAYGGYDAFFKDPARGLIEVGCWAHAHRYFRKTLDSDHARMGLAQMLIAQLYRAEKRARALTPEDRLLRHAESRLVLDRLRDYLSEIQAEILPKSPEGRAVRYTLKNWTALIRYCEDGDLPIDNNATERAIRGVAVGRNNWLFFGSDQGGETGGGAPQLRGILPTGRSRSLRLVQGRPLPNRRPSYHPPRRTAAPQLGTHACLIPDRSDATGGHAGAGDSRTFT